MKRQILSITRKELSHYFGSPLALIFLGTFVAAVLFIFFTIETFFARGIADVRPLFQWMPILLIFLLAALTMRQWSEERHSGTEELLLTLSVSPTRLVLGKFLAVLSLIIVALLLTLPLPITVSIIGNLDWGPVVGGYLAAILLAAAYAAIGLFVSSRTDNQIVALILTVLLGGFFYALGTRGITDLFSGSLSEILWAIGTGSRFESIERGVIDLRDLVYYGSLTLFFLMLNVISVDAIRWSSKQITYRRKVWLTAVLVTLNLLLLNVWLYPLAQARLDITEQQQYSLSQTTKDMVSNLQEPLLIRAYISEKNHPLLQPLVPQIRDMLREYEIAANGMVTAEVIDPITDPEIEAEANQTYGIRPSPFQVADRNEASVINAYFDVLVRYGDQDVVLNFQDLIQVEQTAAGPEARLRNLEYDLTSAVKKVVFGFQSIDAILSALDEPVTLTFYVTPDTLPEEMATFQETIHTVAEDIADNSNGKFIYNVVNVNDPQSDVTPQALFDQYGLQPIPVGLFSADSFYAYMVLESSEQAQVIPPPQDLSEGSIRTAIESSLKRTSTGFLKTVGLWTPQPAQDNNQLLGVPEPLSGYSQIQQILGEEYTVRSVDLSSGQVPANIDMLLVIAPQDLSEEALFAVDQYLMRGGAVVLATNGYQINADNFSGQLSLLPVSGSNVRDWLAHQGIEVQDGLVMDPQNQPFPVAVMRNLGNVQVQEIQALDYPFFVDVRPDGMDSDNPIGANLPAVTMSWASPVVLDEAQQTERETSVLLRSSEDAWLTTDTNIQPNFDLYPEMGFPQGSETQSYPLAVSLQGQFDSFFADQPSPFETPPEETEETAAPEQPETVQYLSTITESPTSARLVVIGSPTFPNDFVLQLSQALTQDRYLNNLQFVQNTVDWSVEDLDLLSIRSRGTATRVLQPMTDQEQTVWEAANYVIALLALVGIFAAWRWRKRQQHPTLPSSSTPRVATEGGK